MITDWIPGEQKPLDDSDCLVVLQIEEERFCRAPVFWWEEKQIWSDEWGHGFQPNEVVKYVLIPELDDGTKYQKQPK